jgi:TcpE family
VELPTYTNIWRIEKRLYKLYDFRLPMPVPVGQVTAFLAIAVPYTLILAMAGMPFSHTWVWLYVLPPGLLAWLATRPVLEGKRLPELVLSQLRYLSEPRTWCRMAPLTEKDEIAVLATVWRRSAAMQPAAAQHLTEQQAGPATPATAPLPVVPAQLPAAGAAAAADDIPAEAGRPVWPSRPAIAARTPAAQAAAPAASWPASAPRQQERARATTRPAVTVRTDSTTARPLHVVERALRSSPGGGADGWHDRVVVVPGGHRPGKPDQVQRDQARARLPLPGPARIVVLGCTGGAGQTVTTLLTGQLLASLRGEAVAVLDLGPPGPSSLTEQARAIPRLLPSRQTGSRDKTLELSRERGLQVVTADGPADQQGDAGRLIDAVVARYPLTLVDPAAGHVPRALQAADQLMLVAPASADAAGSLAMTLEWLEAHDHADLAGTAITVLNGVSDRTGQHVQRAAAVATGRCRAIVRLPWDGRLAGAGAVSMAAVQAYTALAGVLVSGLADPALSRPHRPHGDSR